MPETIETETTSRRIPEVAERRPVDRSGFLASALSSGAIITAWVFVLGWTYLHAYYQFFGINVNALVFPVYHYLVFFFAQFVSFHWQGWLLGAMMLVVFMVIWIGNMVRRVYWAILIGVLLLGLFWGGFHVAERDATYAALQDMGPASSYPVVTLEFKTRPQFQYGAVQDELASSDLRLLLENEDRIFVFQPLKTYDAPIYLDVLALDRKDLIVSKRTVRIR